MGALGGFETAWMLAKPAALVGVLVGGFTSWFVLSVTLVNNAVHASAPGGRPSASIAVQRAGVVHAPLEETFARCLSAVLSLSANVEVQDFAAGRIEARTKMSIKSWGERIHIHLKAETVATTQVWISSEPSARNTLIDYGKGEENVSQIIAWILRADRTRGVEAT